MMLFPISASLSIKVFVLLLELEFALFVEPAPLPELVEELPLPPQQFVPEAVT